MRDLTQLHPDLQKKAKELVDKCAKNGLKIKITECLRTTAEQDALYAQGRTKPGSIVTNAKGSTYNSMHQWGVAFDFCRNDGKGAFNDNDGFFTKVGKIGVSIGLEWGGNWKSIKDKPHFQLPNWGSTTSKLKSQYGTPDKFIKTWNKKASTTKTPAKPAVQNVESKSMKMKVSAKSGINVRTGPGTKYAKARAPLPLGTVVTWTGESKGATEGTWYKVTYKGVTGWCLSKWLVKV